MENNPSKPKIPKATPEKIQALKQGLAEALRNDPELAKLLSEIAPINPITAP